jgi:tetratricopeptide (TPR) repeat protein
MMKLVYISIIVLFFGCSSAPKRPAEIFNLRNQAETQLKLVNNASNRGDYTLALELAEEAMRIAVSSDDPALLVRNYLARGNIYYRLDRAEDARSDWDRALAEAEESKEAGLASLCRIYMLRARLFTLIKEGAAGETDLADISARSSAETALLVNDKLDAAIGYTVTALAEKERRNWAAAEAALKQSLEIHEKGLYLEDAAYDCFLIASVRSVSGNYDGALEALDRAVGFDRRAENSYGLATDWRSRGDVLKKAGMAAGAASAYNRAAGIFRSLGLGGEAEACEKRAQ